MEEEKKKDGMSVKELEGYAQKHRYEIFFCLLFVLASLFTLVFWGAELSVLLAGAGGIISILMPEKIHNFSKSMSSKISKMEKTTQMIVGIVALIVAIFLAPLVFLVIGLHAGKHMLHHFKEVPNPPQQ
ncbi:MAG: hypothetical protein KR126chlam1_01135 [Chlamydiae bacterium]|nr:hypothetical protein [Chlamydiota bacterium]